MDVMPSAVDDDRRFNHTIKYQRELLADLPAHATTALDVGCGEGLGCRQLAAAGLQVTGIDLDEDSITRALAQDTDGITYRREDFMTAELDPAGYDVVMASGSLHHLDLVPALTRLRDAVAPGGRLLIVGMAMSKWPRDIPFEVAASIADKAWAFAKGSWESKAPTVWPPATSYEDIKAAAADLLPGHVYKRHLLWRYTLTWDRPA